MDDKNESEKLMEEMKRIGEGFNKFIESIGEALNKLFYPKEDEWKMKCPYKNGDKYYCIQSDGEVFPDSWRGIESDNRYFSQGNIFPTEEAAELEAKRRKLLTRFRAFRDECNRGLSVQDEKWEIDCKDKKLKSLWLPNSINGFPTFGYFKNREDADRAIELFGDEIIELYVECEGVGLNENN